MDFNSQPHKEADCNAGIIRCGYFISTHSLTRRLTNRTIIPLEESLHFNSQPHKEADDPKGDEKLIGMIFQLTASQGGWLIWSCLLTDRAIFQLTASQGGWRYAWLATAVSRKISTHSLTRRLTVCCRSSAAWTAFQLTASQGGWRKAQVVREVSRHFNSQPHKEADPDL